jgi:hypothetical protein
LSKDVVSRLHKNCLAFRWQQLEAVDSVPFELLMSDDTNRLLLKLVPSDVDAPYMDLTYRVPDDELGLVIEV